MAKLTELPEILKTYTCAMGDPSAGSAESKPVERRLVTPEDARRLSVILEDNPERYGLDAVFVYVEGSKSSTPDEGTPLAEFDYSWNARFKRMRAGMGWSLNDVARIADLSPGTVNNFSTRGVNSGTRLAIVVFELLHRQPAA